MKVQLKTFVAVLLTALLAFGSGCSKDPENEGDNNGNENGGNNNGGNSGGGTTEGMYVGIIGFNDVLKTMPIGLLDSSTEGDFVSFIGSLTMDDNTALYHATNTALDWLQSTTLPADLINVSLLTFTDGLDNASLMLNGNYGTQAEFLDAVNGRIMNDEVQGKSINAYSIGLKGNNVTDEEDFRQKLRKLASSNDNFYLADNMDLVMQRFKEIANQLYNEITIVNTNVKIPGGYDNNTTLRLTFDNVSNANSSTCYIQAVFSREDGKGKLSNINYYGLQSTSGNSTSSSSQEGASYWYTFSDLKTTGAAAQPISNLENMRLWIFNSSTAGWRPEDEFTPSSYTNVSVTQKSAVAVLVLDCTTSLGETDFGKMKDAAMEFITTLNDNSGNGGGGNNGGGNGGGNNEELLNPVNIQWLRNGSQPATGLEEFGLKYDSNVSREFFARIQPIEGSRLYLFDSSVWNSVSTEVDKASAFTEYFEQNISAFCEISVGSSEDYDYVIGTDFNGEYHLIHLTRCDVSTNNGWLSVAITGQAK